MVAIGVSCTVLSYREQLRVQGPYED